MKLQPKFHPLPFFILAVSSILPSCSLPPRDAWRIVQREGLLIYATGEYNPIAPQTRYFQNPPLLVKNQRHQAPATVFAHHPTEPSIRYLNTSGTAAFRTWSDFNFEPETTAPRRRPTAVSIQPPSTNTRTSPRRAEDAAENSSANSVDASELRYGIPAPGRPGMVKSPFASQDQLVEVSGLAVGEIVKCPYSGKLFRVPPMPQQAAKPAQKSETTGQEP